jgi:putative ABC transport system permease protein
LYSVFRIGSATNNVSAASWEHFRRSPAVAWTIPYSLGDSHRGFRVVATNGDFYRHYRFRGERRLSFAAGEPPAGALDAALGADVARALGYSKGTRIVLAHGVSATGLMKHDDRPFRVTGVLERTGTPVDRSIYITLDGMDALHDGWQDGGAGFGDAPGVSGDAKAPRSITAFLIGAKSRVGVLKLQREINEYKDEPLMAILPGVALAELWNTVGYAEQALLLVTGCVALTGLVSMMVALFTTLNERRRELAVFRSLGMSRGRIAVLVMLEAQICALLGFGLGLLAAAGGLGLSGPWLEREFGISISSQWTVAEALRVLGIVLAAGTFAGIFPAWAAYRRSLSDGLTVRI